MAEKSIFDLTPYTPSGTPPASGDLFMFVDVDKSDADKTLRISFGEMTSGLQPVSSVLSSLASGLPSVNGLVFWNGSSTSQITAGSGIAIGSGQISLSKFGIQSLSNPASSALLMVNSSGVSSLITAGDGISLGANISISLGAGSGVSITGTTTKTIALSHLGIQSLADPNADRIMFWDDSVNAMKWLGISSNAGIQIVGTNIEHAPEPVVVSLRAVSGEAVLENGIATYWTVPAELNGATLKTVNMGFITSSGSATVQLARATAASPTTFSNVLTATSVSSNWNSYQSGQTQGTGTVTLSSGNRIRVTLSGVGTAPEGLDVFLGCEV